MKKAEIGHESGPRVCIVQVAVVYWGPSGIGDELTSDAMHAPEWRVRSFFLRDAARLTACRVWTFAAMSKDASEAALASYEILIRSVGQGIREVHGDTTWEAVQTRAESLWHLYAVTTGLDWPQVVDRVRAAWRAAAEPGADS